MTTSSLHHTATAIPDTAPGDWCVWRRWAGGGWRWVVIGRGQGDTDTRADAFDAVNRARAALGLAWVEDESTS